MYLSLISIVLALIVGVADVPQKESYYYYLDSNVKVDSILHHDVPSIQIISDDYSCTKCMETLGKSFEKRGQKVFAVIYKTLKPGFSRNDILEKSLNARTQLSSQLRGFDLDYKIFFDLRPSKIEKTPYLNIRCDDSTLVYPYETIFNDNIEITFCH